MSLVRPFFVLPILAALLSGSAAGASGGKGGEQEIARLEEKSARAPENAEILRDLGLLYLDAGRFDKAMARLKKAARLDPEERTLPLLLGLCHEGRREWAGALDAYRLYRSDDRSSAVARTVRGRMNRVVRMVYEERASALAAEPAPLSPGLLAVRPFEVIGETETYGNLGKGIAEQLINDLSLVKDFPVVPRLLFEALRAEVERSRAAGRDPLAVASLDAMLGAGWSLGGTIAPREEDDEIRIDYFLANNETGEVSPPSTLSGPLADFLALEKRLAFDVIQKFGVPLAEGERRAVAAVPTRHFRAFLAYCDALAAEDRGDSDAARALYAQARRLDPSFALAAERAERTAGSAEAIRAIAEAEIAYPTEIRTERRLARSAGLLLPAPFPERGEASDLSNVRAAARADLVIRVDRP
ncbi:MAG: tetratricopeptide repeat protein [Candidatus Eisenbacteria bacterium]|nr:tetratricopeptide repeat protein [Candidatus Eisenbacteria bacterium]